jgi:hypothetical protein
MPSFNSFWCPDKIKKHLVMRILLTLYKDVATTWLYFDFINISTKI